MKTLGRRVQVHDRGPELEGASQPRDDRDPDDRRDEEATDLHAVRALEDVVDGGVDEDQRDDREGDGQPALAGPPRGQGHGDGGGGDEHQDARRVGAALGVDVGVEDPRHRERDAGEHQDQGTHGGRPLRGHAVAREVAREEVEHAGHRGRAGEPQDRDRGDVVHGPEAVPEVAVREVGQGAAGCGPAVLERRLGDQPRGDQAARDQVEAHDDRRRREQLLWCCGSGRRDAPRRRQDRRPRGWPPPPRSRTRRGRAPAWGTPAAPSRPWPAGSRAPR